MEMILKTNTEMIGWLCLKFFQHASIIYLLLAPVAVSSFWHFSTKF